MMQQNLTFPAKALCDKNYSRSALAGIKLPTLLSRLRGDFNLLPLELSTH